LPIKPNPKNNTFDVTGLLEVTVSGIGGDSKNAKATAVFHSLNPSGNLGAKQIYANAGTITLTQKFVDNFDLTTGATTKRYVQTGFEILNSSATNYPNMTLVATSLAAAATDSGVVTTVGGTAISSLLNNTGGAITDVSVARSVVPTHGFSAGFKSPPVQTGMHCCSPMEPRTPCPVLVQIFAPSASAT
jgi:hypothetical protein